jgi:DNA polymerase-3 subunit epsilon
MLADSIAVLDFETTGMSPAQQARATEIGVVIVEGGQIVARYQSLMNSGAWVPPFIEQLTGISNAMVRSAPPAAQVMQEVAEFVGERPLLAHNASFDQKFWDAELALIRRQRVQPFACSLLLSRRLLPMAPSHKLGNLNRWEGLPDTGKARPGRRRNGGQPHLLYGGLIARAAWHCRDFPRSAVQLAACACGKNVAGLADATRAKRELNQGVISLLHLSRLLAV